MPAKTIPQMIAAHNRAVRMNRRLKRISAAISATVTVMGFIAVSLGAVVLATNLVATAAHISAIGIAK